MAKLVLASVLFASIAIPAHAARDPNPRRGLQKAIWQTLLFDAAYAFAVLFVYPRI